MAESRLLVVTPGIDKTGFSSEITEELAEAGLADILEVAQLLPPQLGIRTLVAPREKDGHISGERLVQFIVDGFSLGALSVCVVRTNALQIPLSYLLEAFGRLTPHRSSLVAGPTLRDGWYLLGASGTIPYSLLKDIFRGVSNVFTETLKLSVTGELSISLLPSLKPVETPGDGQRLLRDMRRGVAAAPHTQNTLRKLGLE